MLKKAGDLLSWGGITALLMAVLGIVWSVGASKIGSNPLEIGSFAMEGSPFSFSGGTGTMFTIFGVVFTLVCVAMAIYEFTNATRPNRFSEIDIVDGEEEPDPLNVHFSKTQNEGKGKDETGPQKGTGTDFLKDEKYCPACGEKMAKGYEYCPFCGGKQP